MRRASCACGSLNVACDGEPVRISVCHCLACQQRTGSAFGVQARFPKERVAIEGPSREYTRTGDSGGRATFRFCPTCGSTVCWELDGLPGFVAIAVGAFADPTFAAPSVQIYTSRKHAWIALPESVEQLD